MKERPILFSAPMVRAILAGNKTQTRRVTKPQPGEHIWTDSKTGLLMTDIKHKYGASTAIICPYGRPGDRLWARESWRTDNGYDPYAPSQIDSGASLFYMADQCEHRINHRTECGPHEWGKTRVSIHMPRWASRILLEITAVRVERLNEINAADSWAEGIPHSPDVNPVHEYEALWESINGAGSWAANPWVWIVEFRRIAP